MTQRMMAKLTASEHERASLVAFLRGEVDGLTGEHAETTTGGAYWNGYAQGLRHRYCAGARLDGTAELRACVDVARNALKRLNRERPDYARE